MSGRNKQMKRQLFLMVITAVLLGAGIVGFTRRPATRNAQPETAAATEAEAPSQEQTEAPRPVQKISAPTEYEIEKPREWTSEEVMRHLSEMAETYTDFEAIYENAQEYPEDLLEALCNNPEMLTFVKEYPEAADDGEMQEKESVLADSELQAHIPLFLQWDQRWGYKAYGDDMMALSGCGPTCLSMVVVGLTGNKEATPDAVGKYAMENGHYVDGVGTSWTLMSMGAEHFGILAQEIYVEEKSMYERLAVGNPVICSVVPGDFTAYGHFIVLTGVKDGKFQVNDPMCKKRSEQLWSWETLEPQINGAWVYSKL